MLALSSCTIDSGPLRFARPVSGIEAEIADDVATLFKRESGIEVELTEQSFSGDDALTAVLDGRADIALVSNAQPYREGIATVIPFFPTVLHIAFYGDRDTRDISTLLQGARVFAGVPGSASRMMFEAGVERLGRDGGEFTYIESITDDADVVVHFAPIAPGQLKAYPGLRLFSLGSPDSIGTGSTVDSATLLNPFLKPFVIPVGTYGSATPEPVLTLAVDKILVANRNLDPGLVYAFISELLRLRPALAARRPAVFRNLTGDFDPGDSTFVLHAGAQAYIERNEPSIYERYSGIAEVVVTVLIALISAVFAGVRLYRRKRKNRIDAYYSEVISVRRQAETGGVARRALIGKLKGLQDRAFEELVDEKLAADESFRIFITLSNDVLRQLGAHEADLGPTDN